VAQQGFNFQELVRRLGLKNVSELPVLQALQPTITVADATKLTPPMGPPEAWTGFEQAGVAAENVALQIRSLGPGGCIIEYLQVQYDLPQQIRGWAAFLERDGTDVLAADPLLNTAALVNIGPDPVLSVVTFGVTTEFGSMPANSLRFPGSNVTGTQPFFPISKWFLPKGTLFTFIGANVASSAAAAIRISDVPVGDPVVGIGPE